MSLNANVANRRMARAKEGERRIREIRFTRVIRVQ